MLSHWSEATHGLLNLEGARGWLRCPNFLRSGISRSRAACSAIWQLSAQNVGTRPVNFPIENEKRGTRARGLFPPSRPQKNRRLGPVILAWDPYPKHSAVDRKLLKASNIQRNWGEWREGGRERVEGSKLGSKN